MTGTRKSLARVMSWRKRAPGAGRDLLRRAWREAKPDNLVAYRPPLTNDGLLETTDCEYYRFRARSAAAELRQGDSYEIRFLSALDICRARDDWGWRCLPQQ